ncbi:hypothetical protein EV363DRAFT_287457 [Boletus edulis]|nr:hypothetical protein EV363DRAFT_287457 [Boletus edulis]
MLSIWPLSPRCRSGGMGIVTRSDIPSVASGKFNLPRRLNVELRLFSSPHSLQLAPLRSCCDRWTRRHNRQDARLTISPLLCRLAQLHLDPSFTPAHEILAISREHHCPYPVMSVDWSTAFSLNGSVPGTWTVLRSSRILGKWCGSRSRLAHEFMHTDNLDESINDILPHSTKQTWYQVANHALALSKTVLNDRICNFLRLHGLDSHAQIRTQVMVA